MKSAVIAFSGGLDSTTLLYSILPNTDRILALTFEYGSRHGEREWEAAVKILHAWPGIEHRRIHMPREVFRGGKSALMNEAFMPHQTYQEINESVGPSPTVVPFRNANIISMCASIASAQGYSEVYVATHATDSHNWAYPDCSPEFMGAMANAVYVGTYHQVRLVTPFTWLTKIDIVERAATFGVPVQLTRSCYEATEVACGICPTCVERIEAFQVQGLIDPIKYANEENIDWFGCKPWPVSLKEHEDG
jgi:7-cyano-7-deazaguanine synthase